MRNRKKPQKPKIEKSLPLAFVQTVQNSDMPVVIPANGNLVAKNRVKLYSEVQGVLEYSAREFKPGVVFKKGEIIYKLNSDEFYTNLLAQKSSFQNQIAAILPDLRIDFPNAFKQWESYLSNFDLNKPLVQMPEPASDKEKLFIAAKNIYTTFYTIKNLEIKLDKFTVTAPFNGVLTEANVTLGTLVSPGQLIGEFVNPSVYELEIAINNNLVSMLKVGDAVAIENLENESKKYTGVISRINQKVDQASQTVKVFVTVSGNGLREGMYVKANLQSKVFEQVMEVPRNLLVNEHQLYVVDKNVLKLVSVELIHQVEKTVIVRGLKSNMYLLAKPIPKAYEGMQVKIYKNKN